MNVRVETYFGYRNIVGDFNCRARKVLHKIIRHIYFKDELLIIEAPIKTTISSLPSKWRCFEINKYSNDLQTAIKSFPSKTKLFETRLNQGLKIYGLFNNDSLCVAYCWFADKKYYEPTRKITYDIPPNHLYMFDGFVLPQYRKGLLVIKFVHHMWADLIKKGFTHITAAVSRKNEPAVKVFSFLGFKETGKRIDSHIVFTMPFNIEKTYSERYLKTRKRNEV